MLRTQRRVELIHHRLSLQTPLRSWRGIIEGGTTERLCTEDESHLTGQVHRTASPQPPPPVDRCTNLTLHGITLHTHILYIEYDTAIAAYHIKDTAAVLSRQPTLHM